MTEKKCFSLIFSIVILLFSACLFAETDSEIEQIFAAERAAYDEYTEYLSEITAAFASQIKEELNLHCSGYGGRMHGTIEYLRIECYAGRRATVEEARALHLLVIEKLVKAVSQHEKVQPFLETRPFTHKQAEICINFGDIHGPYTDGTMYYVSNTSNNANPPNQNLLFFCAKDPFTGDIIDLRDEYYEEAVERNQAFPIKDPSVHPVTEKEEVIDQLLFDFRNEICKKHRLECWSIGGEMTGDIEEIGARFVARRRFTQEEARKLLLEITDRLLEVVNGCQTLKAYLAEDPFSAGRLKLRLSFKKKRPYATYRDGSMESVTLDGGEITYFQETPNQKGVERTSIPIDVPIYAVESYEEGVELVKNGPEPEPFYKKLWSKIFH